MGEDNIDIEVNSDLSQKQVDIILHLYMNDYILEKCGIGRMYEKFIYDFIYQRCY